MTPGDTTESRARALAHARAYARKQADDEMIEGALVVDHGVPEETAKSVIAEVAMELQHHRWAGQCELAERLWDGVGEVGSKMSGTGLALAQALAYQFLSWSKDGAVSQAAKAIREAERKTAREKQSPPKGPTGVAA